MVIVRLARGGAKKTPFYSIVVADSRFFRDGRFIERIGFYNPLAKENVQSLKVDHARLSFWKSHGAQLSDTVTRLVKFSVKKEAALQAQNLAEEKTVKHKTKVKEENVATEAITEPRKTEKLADTTIEKTQTESESKKKTPRAKKVKSESTEDASPAKIETA